LHLLISLSLQSLGPLFPQSLFPISFLPHVRNYLEFVQWIGSIVPSYFGLLTWARSLVLIALWTFWEAVVVGWLYVDLGVGQGLLVELVCVRGMAMGHVWELAVRRFVVQLGCYLGFLGLGFLLRVRLLSLGFVEILQVLVCSFIVAALARRFLSRRVLVRLSFCQVVMGLMVETQFLFLSLLVGDLS